MTKHGHLTKLLILEFIMLFSIAYILYATLLYPIFIPGYGFGETLYLNKENNFTVSIIVSAPRTDLKIVLRGNTSFNINVDGLHDNGVESFEYTVPAYHHVNITLSAYSPATIRLTGRNKIPYIELMFFAGLLILSTGMFIKIYREWKHILRSK